MLATCSALSAAYTAASVVGDAVGAIAVADIHHVDAQAWLITGDAFRHVADVLLAAVRPVDEHHDHCIAFTSIDQAGGFLQTREAMACRRARARY